MKENVTAIIKETCRGKAELGRKLRSD
ncbi:unnamed protein product, partial [Rotaria sp. Silwood1]